MLGFLKLGEQPSLIAFLLKSKDKKNSGKKWKNYLIIIFKIIQENYE